MAQGKKTAPPLKNLFADLDHQLDLVDVLIDPDESLTPAQQISNVEHTLRVLNFVYQSLLETKFKGVLAEKVAAACDWITKVIEQMDEEKTRLTSVAPEITEQIGAGAEVHA